MPFTISHPAIVLPLKRLWPNWFSLSGLIAGAMSPDLLYFLLADTTWRGFSHSWSGLVLFCIPAGMLFSIVFHRLFKYEFIRHLPRPLECWLSGLAVSRFDLKTKRSWVILATSVLVGAMSHFFWDSFTHAAGQVASRIDFFLSEVTVLGYTSRVYRILQHGSSIGGALVIGLYFFFGSGLPSRARLPGERTVGRKIGFWLGAAVTSAAVAALSLWVWASPGPEDFIPGHTRYMFIARVGLGTWAGLFHWTVWRALLLRSKQRDFADGNAIPVSSSVSGNQPAGIQRDL
ncbi:MAG: DUF4184 family protein [candidate division Zixibacteria bacterium]|nr:DUF4184 family protein [candidate division Zixibacteria bacterium]